MITAQEIRDYMEDACLQGGVLDLGLTFTDPEIATAMKATAREFNGLPFPSFNVCASDLPSCTNTFFDGVAKHLFLLLYKRLMRTDIDYTAGGVTTNIVAKRLGHAEKLAKLHGDMFKEAAVEMRLQANIRQMWGQVG